MIIPQLFIKVGANRFIPVSQPENGKSLYYWDELRQQITLADGMLRRQVIEDCPYFVLDVPSNVSKIRVGKPTDRILSDGRG